ncbi:hypothetical protein [Methyloceanibacter caenitepidi]|uniref:Uncharacterized protein n=1 Tax=Methyloceanibacter caenitepidi TaxID=1384459 RepID=A0A0A8K281_9HYPH|nr:hypothetical protein [Methyloceanibacter caenitepidi]BAQ16109.1 hypothetical protein GL4_0646 [Methyloceanibacter caenitepidi]
MPVVTMPDGVPVAFPDDMPPEQIRSLIEQKFPDAAAQASAQRPQLDLEVEQPGVAGEEPGVGNVWQGRMGNNPLTAGIGAVFDLFGPAASSRGAIEGVSDLASVANPVGGGSLARMLPKAMDQIFGPADEMSPRENLGRNVVRLGTNAIIPAAGMAGNVERAARPAATFAGRMGQKLMEPYAVNPGRAVAGDVAGGVGAGTGISAYEEYAPESVQESGWDPVAKTVAALLGGVGGITAMQGARGAVNTARTGVKSRLGLDNETTLPVNEATGQFFKADEVNEAAKFVQEGASDPEAAVRTMRETISQLGDGPLPTTGPLTNDVGMLQMEGGLRRRGPKPFIERDRAVDTAASARTSALAPEGSTGRDATDYLENVQRERVGQAQMEERNAQEAQDLLRRTRRQEAAPLQSMAGEGGRAAARIDETVVDQTLVPTQERMSANYRNVDPDRSAVVDVSELVDQADAVRASLGDLNDPAKVLPRGLLNRIENTVPPEDFRVSPDGTAARPVAETSIGDIVEVMPEMSATISRAQKAQNYRLADNLRSLRDSMKGVVADAAEQGDEAAQRFMQADEDFAATMGPTFKRGPGDEAQKFRKDFNLDRHNRSTTPPSATADRFLRPGQPEKAQALNRIFDQAPNPEAGRQAVRDYLLSDLANSGAIDPQSGALLPQVIRQWRQRWGASLDEFPEIGREVDDLIGRAQRGADMEGAAEDLVRTAQRGVEEAQTNTGALRFALGNDPEHMIGQALSSGDSERAIGSLVNLTEGNPSARAGLKSALVDYLVKTKTTSAVGKTTDNTRPVSFAKLDDLFKKHERALAQVLEPEEMNQLRQVHKMLSISKRDVQATTGSQTAERLSSGPISEQSLFPLEAALRLKFGMLKGGGIMSIIKKALRQMKGSETDNVDQLMRQMAFDPELARHLLTRQVDVGGKAWNAKLNRLIAYGAGARAIEEDGGEAPPPEESQN